MPSERFHTVSNVTVQPRQSLGTLDHLVITTVDLAAACDECEARLGVRPEPGGTHPQFGTHNALLGLGKGAYVEIIAIDPDAEARPQYPFNLAEVTGSQACTFAVHPQDLDQSAASLLDEQGLAVGPAGPGSRSTPEGTVLNWRLTAPLAADPSGLVPFLIDWQGGPSPADSITSQVELVGWGGSHPRPTTIAAALDQLGVPVQVTQGAPDFWVELRGPSGSWRL